MAGIRVTNGKFKDIVSGRKNTIFANNGSKFVEVGNELYLWKSVKVDFNQCGYWYTDEYLIAKVTEVTQFTKGCSPHVKFKIVGGGYTPRD